MKTPPKTPPTETIITHAGAAYETLKVQMRNDIEEFWALALGPGKLLLAAEMIFRGTVDACLIHPRDVFRFACRTNASGLIIAHNHPSGDSRPSEQDLLMTRRLVEAADLFEIPILDHLILVDGGYSSFADERWGPFRESASERNLSIHDAGPFPVRSDRLPSDRPPERRRDDAELFRSLAPRHRDQF